MKYRIIIFISITLIVLNACEALDVSPVLKGFFVKFLNETNEVYDAKLFIGGLEKEIFTATDSIEIKQIELGGNSTLPYFVSPNRWEPDLNKIKNIPSDSCYFKLKLSNSREELIKVFGTTNLFSLKLPDKSYFEDNNGSLIIVINSDQIYAIRPVE